MNQTPILGLTMGDPAGIGPELCARALGETSVLDGCVPVLFGDAAVLGRLESNGIPRPAVPVCSLSEWERMSEVREPLIVDCATLDASSLQPGVISADCGRSAYEYIRLSIEAAMAGRLAGVVTAPIHKEALRLAGVSFPGHTEIFTALTGTRRSCMMLYSDQLTVSMATTHIGYAQVPGSLTVERVSDVIMLTHQAMERMRGRPPRLAICGLNPHAGEHGLFGDREEERLVEPALAQAREAGIQIEGPLPPDTAFTTTVRERVDAIVTLYHDQGHIPFKMLAFDTGVNITLGLPIIRTSVDHGTAFDIAWKGKASPTSLFAAIRVAADMAAGVAASAPTVSV